MDIFSAYNSTSVLLIALTKIEFSKSILLFLTTIAVAVVLKNAMKYFILYRDLLEANKSLSCSKEDFARNFTAINTSLGNKPYFSDLWLKFTKSLISPRLDDTRKHYASAIDASGIFKHSNIVFIRNADYLIKTTLTAIVTIGILSGLVSIIAGAAIATSTAAIATEGQAIYLQGPVLGQFLMAGTYNAIVMICGTTLIACGLFAFNTITKQRISHQLGLLSLVSESIAPRLFIQQSIHAEQIELGKQTDLLDKVYRKLELIELNTKHPISAPKPTSVSPSSRLVTSSGPSKAKIADELAKFKDPLDNYKPQNSLPAAKATSAKLSEGQKSLSEKNVHAKSAVKSQTKQKSPQPHSGSKDD